MYIVYKNVVISIYCRLASKLINPVLRLFFYYQIPHLYETVPHQQRSKGQNKF